MTKKLISTIILQMLQVVNTRMKSTTIDLPPAWCWIDKIIPMVYTIHVFETTNYIHSKMKQRHNFDVLNYNINI